MRKLFLSLFLIAYPLAAPAQTRGVWYKLGVVVPPTAGDLNGGSSFSGTSNSDVLYEGSCQLISPNADGKCFKMWFQGANNTYYAEANNAIGPWTRNASAIVTGKGLPKIFKNSGTYYLYVTPSPALSAIATYTSSDGVIFTQQNPSSILPGASGSAWDHSGIYYLVPVFNSAGTWSAVYSGALDGALPQTGVATSTDLINWTKYPGNPVANNYVDMAAFHVLGPNYYAWGSRVLPGQGGASPFVDPQDIIRASTPNLINWSAQNVTMTRTQTYEGVGSANGELTVPSLVEVDGKTYIFTTSTPDGTQGLGYQITAAVANMTIDSLLASPGGNAINFIQAPTPATFAVHATFPQTFTSPPTVGNLLVAGLYVATAGGVPATISGGCTNSWVPGPTKTFSTESLVTWYCTKADGTSTVTVTPSSSASGSTIIAEYNGVNFLDQSNSGSAGTGTAMSSGNVTTRHPSELLVAIYASFQGNLAAQTVGTGGAGTSNRIVFVGAWGLSDNVVNALGTYSATANNTNGAWAAAIMTFSNNARNVQAPYTVP